MTTVAVVCLGAQASSTPCWGRVECACVRACVRVCVCVCVCVWVGGGGGAGRGLVGRHAMQRQGCDRASLRDVQLAQPPSPPLSPRPYPHLPRGVCDGLHSQPCRMRCQRRTPVRCRARRTRSLARSWLQLRLVKGYWPWGLPCRRRRRSCPRPAAPRAPRWPRGQHSRACPRRG
jgi:hypothetical protein